MAALPGLGFASTASTGTRLSGSRSEVWLCQAYDSNAQGLILYVKPSLTLRALLVEALAAQIGQCLRLPCPDPYIVTVNPLHVGRPKGKHLLAFGSVQAGMRGLARPVRDVEVMLKVLEKLGIAETACVFDEWIANPVRAPGDVLIDPEGGAALIDHECAMDPLITPDAGATNWLAQRVIERVAPGKRGDLLKALRARAAAAHRATLTEAPSVVQAAQSGVEIYRSLLEFLAARLGHLDRLLSVRVLPEQAYLTESLPKNDADRTTSI